MFKQSMVIKSNFRTADSSKIKFDENLWLFVVNTKKKNENNKIATYLEIFMSCQF